MIESIVKSLERPYGVGSFNIVCLGDSFTHGAFESYKEMHAVFDFEAVFHNLLRKRISEKYPSRIINMINSGIGGDTAYNSLNRFDRDVTAYHPDLVIVSYCANDVFGEKEKYSEALKSIFSRLNEQNVPTVLLAAYPMCSYVSDEIHKPELRECARALSEFQKSGRVTDFQHSAIMLAGEYGVTVCNCYDMLLDKYGEKFTEHLANHINHPTREMHRLFADELYKTIIE